MVQFELMVPIPDKVGIVHPRSDIIGSGPRTTGVFFIYILRSIAEGKYYIGSTDDPNRRLNEHNKGLSKYTKAYKPWELIYTEKFQSLSQARIREKQIKSWKKRAAIEKLIKARSSIG